MPQPMSNFTNKRFQQRRQMARETTKDKAGRSHCCIHAQTTIRRLKETGSARAQRCAVNQCSRCKQAAGRQGRVVVNERQTQVCTTSDGRRAGTRALEQLSTAVHSLIHFFLKRMHARLAPTNWTLCSSWTRHSICGCVCLSQRTRSVCKPS